MRLSFRQRLILTYLLVAALTTVVSGAVALLLVGAYNARAERDYLRANALRVATYSIPLLGPNPPADAAVQLEQAARFYSFATQTRVMILDAGEQARADSGSPLLNNTPVNPPRGLPLPGDPGNPNQPRPPEVAPIPIGALGDPSPLVTARSSESVQIPVYWPDNQRVIGYVQLSEGPAFGTAIVESVSWALAGGALIGALLAVVLGLTTATQVARPLETLGRAAQRMAAGDLHSRAAVHGDDEFARLGTQFNQMAQQVESGFAALDADREALRRFVADAAHELRTPLTAATTFVELAQDGGPRHDEFLASAAAQLARLSRVVRSLLDLSLLDAGASRIRPVPGDLQALCRDACAAAQPLAAERGLSLTAVLGESAAPATFDESYLRRALDNLLGNAVKFTPAGGTIVLGLECSGDRARVSVRDTGPGIAPEDLPHLFERFYRGKNDAQAEGSGLGLAIAHAIVAAHGGALTADNAAGGGARFVVELPVSR
jgi:signal transduction histidine kinase